MSEVRAELTDYGFKFGAAEVTRLTEVSGNVWIRVATDAGQTLDIYASPKGRPLRVSRNGRELT